ncbi:hypothetical protein DFH09DRAFT_1205258 [Mycena vulgaris]|nr:hypothetical protein DFH09DRAFT_1205258 [Mycena vulgaris]
MKPPLRLVESYFQSTWRTPDDPRERAAVAKHWERYREIPQWIAASSERRAVAPPVIIAELEAMRLVDGKPLKGLNWLRGEVEKKRKEAKVQSVPLLVTVGQPDSSPPTSTTGASLSSSTSLTSALGPPFSLQEEPEKRKRAKALDPRRGAAKKIRL